MNKYGLNNLNYIILEFYNLNDKTLLTNFKTTYLFYFNVESLYNFKVIGQSILGYKHSPEAKQKMLNISYINIPCLAKKT